MAKDKGFRMDRATAPGIGPASDPIFEDIAKPTDGMDQFLGKGIIHLGAQASDMDINDVGISFAAHVPDLFGKVGSR